MYYDECINIYIPTFICLIYNKMESTYKEIFKFILENILKNKINTKNLTITCDFETAMINSIKDTFIDARIVGCYFHFLQALIRKAKQLGYGKSKFKKELSLLPFKYKNNIEEIKNIINNIKNNHKDFNDFFNYFESEWIPFFNNNMLKYKDIPKNIRTNNSIESLNGRLKKMSNYKANVTWLQYIDIILKLEKEYKEKIINLESLNTNNSINKNKTRKYENKIKSKNHYNIYFFKWNSFSCRFDSILFILYF